MILILGSEVCSQRMFNTNCRMWGVHPAVQKISGDLPPVHEVHFWSRVFPPGKPENRHREKKSGLPVLILPLNRSI